MDIKCKKDYLRELFYKGQSSDKHHRFQPDIAKRYVHVINIFDSVDKVTDLYCYKALHYEKLVGDKNGLESARVNDQYRIELTGDRYLSGIIQKRNAQNSQHFVGTLMQFYVIIPFVFHYNSINYSLWQELYKLGEGIFPSVHRITNLFLGCKGSQFKSSPLIFLSKTLYLSNLQTSPLIFSGH